MARAPAVTPASLRSHQPPTTVASLRTSTLCAGRRCYAHSPSRAFRWSSVHSIEYHCVKGAYYRIALVRSPDLCVRGLVRNRGCTAELLRLGADKGAPASVWRSRSGWWSCWRSRVRIHGKHPPWSVFRLLLALLGRPHAPHNAGPRVSGDDLLSLPFLRGVRCLSFVRVWAGRLLSRSAGGSSAVAVQPPRRFAAARDRGGVCDAPGVVPPGQWIGARGGRRAHVRA